MFNVGLRLHKSSRSRSEESSVPVPPPGLFPTVVFSLVVDVPSGCVVFVVVFVVSDPSPFVVFSVVVSVVEPSAFVVFVVVVSFVAGGLGASPVQIGVPAESVPVCFVPSGQRFFSGGGSLGGGGPSGEFDGDGVQLAPVYFIAAEQVTL